MPTLDAANIALTLLSAATEALLVGPCCWAFPSRCM
jgi:phosphotransacetylase